MNRRQGDNRRALFETTVHGCVPSKPKQSKGLLESSGGDCLSPSTLLGETIQPCMVHASHQIYIRMKPGHLCAQAPILRLNQINDPYLSQSPQKNTVSMSDEPRPPSYWRLQVLAVCYHDDRVTRFADA